MPDTPLTDEQLAQRNALTNSIPGAGVAGQVADGIGAIGAAAPAVGGAVQNAFGLQQNPLAAPPPPTGPVLPPPGPTPPPVAEQPFVPPGPQKAETTDSHTQTTMGVKLDPAIQAKIAGSRSVQADAQAHALFLQSEQDKQLAATEQKRANEEAAQRKVQEEAAAQRKQIADDYAAKIVAAQKEVEAVKPIAEETTGTRIINAIALGLGAFGASMNGGPNQAAQIIAANRDQKMQAWKAQYARAKGKVDSAENLYAMFRNKGLDEVSAEALTNKNMNADYDTIIRTQMAGSKAPLTIANGEAELERLKQNNLAQDQALKEAAQNHVTKIVDDKALTKTGGDTKEQNELIKAAGEEDNLKRYREDSRALSQFQSLRKAGADGQAIAEWVTGKDGLSKRTLDPEFLKMLKERGVLGQSAEDLRKKWAGGVAPDLLNMISNGLAAQTYSSRQKAAPAIGHFQRAFHQAGIDPRMVMGGETSDEAAAAAGASPAAYQGRQ